MATANTASDFVISAAADRLLSSLSSDFADLIMMIARDTAKENAEGDRVVTTDDVKVVLSGVCDLLEHGVESGHASKEVAAHVEQLRAFCAGIASERK